MIRHSLFVSGVVFQVLWAGCRLDSFMFNSTKVDEPYDFSDSLIPQDHYDPDGVFVEAADGTKIHLYFVTPSGDPAERADTTIFYCHGNRDNIGHYWDRVEIFYQMGYGVLIFDYRGFGMSEGESTEEGLYEDADAALAYLVGRGDVDPDRIVFYGYSLGAAVCIEAAVRHPDLAAALIVESGFRSVQDLVLDSVDTSLDVSFVSDLRFDNIHKIGRVACPVFVMHGAADDYLKPGYGRNLYDAAPDPKQFWLVAGADHTNVPGEPDSDRRTQYVAKVTEFVDRWVGAVR